MVKEAKVILTGFWMVIFLIIATGAYLFYSIEDPISIVSGNSIKEMINRFYEASSVNHRIFILSQFILLFVIVISFYIIIRKFKSKTKLSKEDFIMGRNTKSRTDLDTLYDMLKRKKEIDINNIMKIFKVNSEVALGWSKILENGELAMIDYPRFGKPILRLVENNNEEEEPEPREMVKNKNNVKYKKIKGDIQNTHHKDIFPVKKIPVPKIISKKELRKNKKIKKQAEKKLRKRKTEKIKKVKKKSKK